VENIVDSSMWADSDERGGDDAGPWRDLAFVVKHLREAGAQRVVVGGASLGAMESLHALSRGLDADGLIWVAGIDLFEGVAVTEQVRGLRIPSSSSRGSWTVRPGSPTGFRPEGPGAK
jgi:pimeloyl-ACP methyl ester carboxylesterase